MACSPQDLDQVGVLPPPTQKLFPAIQRLSQLIGLGQRVSQIAPQDRVFRSCRQGLAIMLDGQFGFQGQIGQMPL